MHGDSSSGSRNLEGMNEISCLTPTKQAALFMLQKYDIYQLSPQVLNIFSEKKNDFFFK